VTGSDVADTVVFRDRRDAGRRLAPLVAAAHPVAPVVYGIARGGVPVAAAIADALGAPLDVVLVRKVGAPGQREYAIGAVAEGGVRVLSARALERLRIPHAQARDLLAEVETELAALGQRFGASRARVVSPAGRTAVIVDDGLATGLTALAAVRSLRVRGASRVFIAAPVASRDAAESLRGEADAVVCFAEPEELWAVGYWYADFSPTTDEEVLELLRAGAAEST